MELAKIKESQGDLAEAASILQELQVQEYVFGASIFSTAIGKLRHAFISLETFLSFITTNYTQSVNVEFPLINSVICYGCTCIVNKVETFGSMDKVEKVQFILEQMRLCLATGDHIRTQIVSKKISTKFFNSTEDLVQVTVHALYYLK